MSKAWCILFQLLIYDFITSFRFMVLAQQKQWNSWNTFWRWIRISSKSLIPFKSFYIILLFDRSMINNTSWSLAVGVWKRKIFGLFLVWTVVLYVKRCWLSSPANAANLSRSSLFSELLLFVFPDISLLRFRQQGINYIPSGIYFHSVACLIATASSWQISIVYFVSTNRVND